MFILIFFKLYIFVNSKIILENFEAEHDLADLARKTYQIYSSGGKTTLVIHNEFDPTCDKFFSLVAKNGFNMSFYTFSTPKNVTTGGKHDGDKADLTIIFINTYNMNNFDRYVNKVSNIPSFGNYSKFLIVFTTKPPQGVGWLENTFKLMWDFKMMRIFIAYWWYGVRVYTFNPFTNEYSIDITNATDKKKQFYMEFELFDLNGYPMKIFVWDHAGYKDRIQEKYDENGKIEYLGYDGKLLTQVRDILNVTLEIERESFSHRMDAFSKKINYTHSSGLYEQYLRAYKIDIFFTAIRAKSDTQMDNLFLHERDDYVIIVPEGEKIPEYLYIYFLIPIRVWITISIAMVLVSLVLYLIRKTKHFPNSNYLESFFDVYKIILNVPLSYYNNNYQEQYMLCTWLIFSILFSVSFNCTMVSTLVVPKYYPTINTIEELTNTNMSIWTNSYEYNIMKASLNDKDVKLLDKFAICNDQNFSTNIYSFQNKSGFLMRFERAREFMKITGMIGKTRYHIVEEHPLPNAQSYLMTKGHPYLEEIQWIIHKVHESGLWYEWRKTNYGKENISTGAPPMFCTESTEILKLFHLKSVFVMLGIGLFVSFLAFSVEYLIQKI